MIRFLLRALIVAVGLWAASKLISGVEVHGWKTLLIAAVVLGLVNATVRPIITLLTLPATILTLGLFLLVINGGMVLLTAWLLQKFGDNSFQIRGWGAAILTTIVVWAVSLVGNLFLGGDEDRRSRRR
jgi:putative membrane protein